MRFLAMSKLVQYMACVLLVSAGSPPFAQITTSAVAAQSPEDGGPRRWEAVGGKLRLFGAASLDADVIEIFADGAVLSNLGCSEILQTVWCEVRALRGKPQGFVVATGLRPAVGPDNVVPMGIDDSKHRAGRRDFDAKTNIACAQDEGEALGTCLAQVARSDGGDATLVVTFANGFARKLFFVHGEFVRASATMSGVGTDTTWQLTEETYFIRVDDQRYEVPEHLIVTRN